MVPIDTILRTRRCLLRAVEHRDLEHVWTASRYPGFNDGMLWDAPATREDMAGWTARNLANWANGAAYTLSARHIETDMFIGRVMVRPLDVPGSCRIGFWIHPTLWNRGYATEIAGAAVGFAFEILRMERVSVAHALWNKASERVIAKLGFTFTRYLVEGFKKRGQWVPENEYTTTRAQWICRESAAHNPRDGFSTPEVL